MSESNLPPPDDTLKDYDWSYFDLALVIGAPVERVFSAWVTAAGLESFFIREARITSPDGARRRANDPAQAGDRYEFAFLHDFELSGAFLAVRPPHEVSFTFGHPMTVTVRTELNEDGRTLCLLKQEHIPVDPAERPYAHMNCRSCWIYFMMALKARLEHGIELRDLDPRTADAISVHLAPQLSGARPKPRTRGS